jgi:pimeloyl-ACP methyl ester carboxylesterase
MATFLLVPGAWLGGWCWRDVARPLRAAGHTVVTATLTGLGERAHLVTPQIGLDTHVSDIVGLFRYRELDDVTLIGHSYGGTVITAVAEHIPERIYRLVYLDASITLDGESNNDVIGTEMAGRLRDSAIEGWLVPPFSNVVGPLTDESLRSWVAARLRHHPLQAFEDPVHLDSPEAAALPRAFIRTTSSPLYDRLLAYARAEGWYCREIGGGHYSMFTQPGVVASALMELST